MPGTLGVILAAGAGTRFLGETHKLRATIGDKTVIGMSIAAALGADLNEVAVVTGAVDLDDLIPSGVTVLHNDDWASGQAISLRLAADYADLTGRDAIVVALGDQPGITSSAWAALGASDAALARATYAGVGGHPIRLGREIWDELPTSGDFGARDLLASHKDFIKAVPCEGSPTDVDSLEDLLKWK